MTLLSPAPRNESVESVLVDRIELLLPPTRTAQLAVTVLFRPPPRKP